MVRAYSDAGLTEKAIETAEELIEELSKYAPKDWTEEDQKLMQRFRYNDICDDDGNRLFTHEEWKWCSDHYFEQEAIDRTEQLREELQWLRKEVETNEQHRRTVKKLFSKRVERRVEQRRAETKLENFSIWAEDCTEFGSTKHY